MTNILKITDGTTTIDLLSNNPGFHLVSWTPQVAGLKSGGIYQSSDVAPGRDLVYGQFDNVNEVFNLHVNETNQDAVIYNLQEFFRLLQKARNYWLTVWQDTPVYIIAQSECETNIRYALIKNYTFSNLSNPYAQPFFTADNLKGMNGLSLGIERGHWLANIPGNSDCVQNSSQVTWIYEALWTVEDSLTNATAFSFLTASDGSIYAGIRVAIKKSTDNGDSWSTVSTDPGGNVEDLEEASNGNILASDSAGSIILYSTNDGATWGVAGGDAPTGGGYFVKLSNGTILMFDSGADDIFTSTDNGLNYSSGKTHPFVGGAKGASLLSDGSLLVWADNTGNGLFRSTDTGTSWTQLVIPETRIDHAAELANGYIYATSTSKIYFTTDITLPFGLLTTVSGAIFNWFTQASNGDVYLSDSDAVTSNIYRSIDNMVTLVVDYSRTAENIRQIVEGADGVIISGSNDDDTDGAIFRRVETSTTLGRSATCLNEVYVVNKQNVANLTHIKINDGGVFSDIFPISSYPQSLLPAVPAANDAIYFGIDTSVANSGPFSNLIFDLSQAAALTTSGSFTIIWEYYNGSWVTLTTRDNTSAFRLVGVNAVAWATPSDWTTVAIDSVTAYWVRARLSALSGTIQPPQQSNRDIYTSTVPVIDIASDIVKGDIPAIAQIKVRNQSDADGPGGSAPNLYSNRIIVGLRSYTRGPNFQAFINLSDEQNPIGVTISAGTNTSFVDDVQAATGRRMRYNPSGAESMTTRATITLSTTIARDFYGVFHAFLRARRTTGNIPDIGVRLQIVSGSGGVSYNTETKYLQSTTAFEVVDFGQIKFPATGNLGLSEIGDTATINVQASAASGTPDLYLYDLVLMPVDEWAIDAVDRANESDSDVGRSNSIQKLLNIDSLTVPKYPIRALVQVPGSGQTTSIYDAITPGEAILQANVQQRLWFMAMNTSSTGIITAWYSPIEIVNSIQIFKNERYLGLRGNR